MTKSFKIKDTEIKKDLLTRDEIIDIWSMYRKYKEIDSYCCPYCRGVLTEYEDGSFCCDNEMCLNAEVYVI